MSGASKRGMCTWRARHHVGGVGRAPCLNRLSACTTFRKRLRPQYKADNVEPRLERDTDLLGSDTTVRRAELDPQAVATSRLQELLRQASSGDDLIRREIANLGADTIWSLLISANLLIAMVSFLISWSCGFDPFGGFTLSGRSLAASGVGVLCAAPLIACSAFSRSRGARSAFPALDHLHQAQSDALQPLLANLTLPQAVILAAMQVPPTLMLLLPATHASTVTIGAALHSTLLSVFNDEHGLLLPEGACQLLSFLAPLSWLMLSGLAAASFASSAIGMRRQQLQSLQTAVRHADRFFRFKLGHELYTDGQAAKQAAVAFKCKAGRWMLLERKAAQLAYNSTLLNVIYLGIIWEYTGDLATPATAALLAAAAECCFVQRELQQRSN